MIFASAHGQETGIASNRKCNNGEWKICFKRHLFSNLGFDFMEIFYDRFSSDDELKTLDSQYSQARNGSVIAEYETRNAL